jgi:hypothetical protein
MPGRDSPHLKLVPREGQEQQADPLRAVGAAADTATAASSTNRRRLSEAEVQVLRKVFGEGLAYGRMRLVRMGSFIERLNGARAFVLGNDVNLPASNYQGLLQGKGLPLLVHESVHIWQYQHQGWGYVPASLWAQGFGDGYDYVKALRTGMPWRKMNPEQQAELIQSAFQGGYFDAPGARFGVVVNNNTGFVVPPGRPPPADFVDHTPVLVAALEALQQPA